MQTEELRQSRIHQLDNRLANQIAAGEVVERPASVVKELLENSIDAGATRIEVDIERGGTRLIRISDNGSGIVKDDLKLALSRHATSKITSSEDLAAISSLGFRGEALASIASVAKLVLTSRTADSEFAWQAIAEGRDMSVKIQPASASVGTRIEVRDLFYNTPARQKFLRAEKTEFAHIEEIFKRHALANHSIAFILKHNHKVVRRIPAINYKTDLLKRIEAICGKPFAQHAIAFDCYHELVNLKGWTGGSSYHRSESDIQYVFVNNRPVKDKMLNHAIRQAFQDRLPAGRMPTFIMFLEVDPASIDVNVHPTKHEIRFDQQRMIHDLIVHSIMESLAEKQIPLASLESSAERNTTDYSNQKSNLNERAQQAGVGYSQVKYSQSKNGHGKYGHGAQPNHAPRENFSIENKLDIIFDSKQSQAMLATSPCFAESAENNELTDQSLAGYSATNAIGNNYLLINRNHDWFIVDSNRFVMRWLSSQLLTPQALPCEPLLFPKEITIDTSLFEQLEVVEVMQQFGFCFSPKDQQSVMLSKTPRWLHKVENELVVSVFAHWAQLLSDHFQSERQSKILTGLEADLTKSLEGLSVNIAAFLLEQGSVPDENPAVIKLTDTAIAKMFN